MSHENERVWLQFALICPKFSLICPMPAPNPFLGIYLFIRTFVILLSFSQVGDSSVEGNKIEEVSAIDEKV
jgi:hypothetical protein